MATEMRDEPVSKEDGKGKRKKVGKRTSPALFVRQIVAELRKVIWPTRRELMTYTAVSLVFVIFMVALVSGLDWGLQEGVYAVFG